jgi:hypothetical protein
VRIGANHVAEDDMLGSAEQTLAGAATFTVARMGHVPAEDLALHLATLAISAQATRSLGANRRRGLGWVHITCQTRQPGPDQVRLLLTGGPS